MGAYEELGVSSDKAAVHAAVKRHDPGLFPEAFCKLLPDYLGWPVPDPLLCNLQHGDGTGSKVLITYLRYLADKGLLKEWIKPVIDALIMNIDDGLCVGSLGPFLVTELISRNTHKVGDEIVGALIDGVYEYAEFLTDLGIPTYVAGGETADLPDQTNTLTLDMVITGRFPRAHVIDASRIKAGSVIVGFSSTGQANWEHEPNSGFGSNGATDARHRLMSPYYLCQRESFSGYADPNLVYQGNFRLEDPLPGDERFTIGSAIASPTRTYAPLFRELFSKIDRQDFEAIIHKSGGGQTKIKGFGPKSLLYRKTNLFPTPAIFQLLRKERNLSMAHAMKYYNMGDRMEAVFAKVDTAEKVMAISRKRGIGAEIIGEVIPRDEKNHPGARVVIKHEGEMCEYDDTGKIIER